MAVTDTASSAQEASASAFPIGQLHGVTFNLSWASNASGWDRTAQNYVIRYQSLLDVLELAGRSLDGKVVNITAKAWRDRGHLVVEKRLGEYEDAREALFREDTIDPENIAGKVRLVAEMLGLSDPWRPFKTGWPSEGSREAEAFTPLVKALAFIYRDLRLCRREMDALRKQAAKARKGGKRARKD